MPITEFELIERFFKRKPTRTREIILGIGDDAAVVRAPAGYDTVIAIDMLNAGIHFPPDTAAADIGYKALAVNLSDIAAMGAIPAWFTLALSLPDADEAWLAPFSEGMFALAAQHQVDLIGGDTTRGPLSVTIQIGGWVKPDQYLPRAGAQVGDRIYVSGTLGDAAAGLALLPQQRKDSAALHLVTRLLRPTPRVALGQKLVTIANACIDISDGLTADLGHILQASAVGARIQQSAIPISSALHEAVTNPLEILRYALAGGDDYELCFTVPAAKVPQLENLRNQLDCSITQIGEITQSPGLQWVSVNGDVTRLAPQGFQHF
jgi:thiamine-monophosphate kinase